MAGSLSLHAVGDLVRFFQSKYQANEIDCL